MAFGVRMPFARERIGAFASSPSCSFGLTYMQSPQSNFAVSADLRLKFVAATEWLTDAAVDVDLFAVGVFVGTLQLHVAGLIGRHELRVHG
jgi:hypothetical protein